MYANGLDDTISRLSAIADDDGIGSPGQILEAYTYLGVSTVVERLHPESGVDLTYIGGGIGDAGDIVTGLDRFGRIVDQHWIDGMSTATDRFQYGYDENSNRLFRRNVVDATFSELYDYDDFNQLSDFARGTLSTTSDSIVGTPVRSQDWSPHPLGNAATISTSISGTPTPEGRLYNAQNQFTSVGGNSINYDANGNLITDQHGNIYKYDAWNRLVKVEDSSNDLLTAYSYNALNRRIIEDDGSTETHLFYSANWQVLEEQVASDTTVQYVWSPVYIDALILRDRDTDSNGDLDERLYVQQDANFNVSALVDTSGVVVQRFVQDPFGLVTDVLDDSWTPQSDAFDWKYLHQGLRLDMAVGMNLYDGRNRIYDPVLQRWLQVDPSGFDAGDGNLYRYVGNRPVNLSDPSGLEPDLAAWKAKWTGDDTTWIPKLDKETVNKWDGKWKSVTFEVYDSDSYLGRDLDKAVTRAAHFYARYGVLIKWHYHKIHNGQFYPVTAAYGSYPFRPPHEFAKYFSTVRSNTPANQVVDISNEPYFQWFLDHFQDVPTIFGVADLSIKGSDFLPGVFGADANGMTYKSFVFIPSMRVPWAAPRDTTIAHEIGHVLGLPHDSRPKALMDCNQRGELDRTKLYPDEIELIRRSLKPISNP